MREIWKDIKDYEGLYQVSNLGRIKSLKKKFGKVPTETILTPAISVWGYARVCLIKDKKGKNIFIHRIVAETFLPNPDNKSQVNHIDADKLNNKLNNLEWVTAKENINRSEKVKNMNRWNEIPVKDNKGNHFKSYRQAGKFWNISPNTVKRDCLGLTKYGDTQIGTQYERQIRFSFE